MMLTIRSADNLNFEYSSDEILLQKTVREMLKNEFPLTKVRDFIDGKATNNSELISLLGKQGLLGTISWDEQEEKIDGVIYSVLIAYEAGRGLVPFPLVENNVASYLVSRFGNEKLTSQISSGEKIITIAWESIGCNVDRIEDRYVVNGTYTYVPFAEQSDYGLIQFTTPTGDEALAIIYLQSSQVSTRKRNSFDDTYPLYDVTLNNYEISESDLVCEIGLGGNLFNEAKQLACLLLAAEMLGGAEELLKVSVNYANERKQFDQPISKFQAIKHMASEMHLLIESSKTALDYATWALDSNHIEEFETVSSILKSYVSDISNKVSGNAIQIHGGMGYTWESDVHLYFKRIRRCSVMFGDPYFHREKIANYILGKLFL